MNKIIHNINWYKDRICLNVLAKDLANAKEIYQAANKHVLVGILSKSFSDYESALIEMTKWAKAIDNNISIGLGAGDPKQSYMVAKLTKNLLPNHANQVFTAVGLSIKDFSDKKVFINCLVSPTGTPGLVKINTGPISSTNNTEAIVDIETTIDMIKDMGGNSIKFFNMNGLATIEEYQVIAKACAKKNFALEPTGGITLDNFETIIKIALDAGVPKIIPHVYSAIIDKATGKTNPEAVKQLLEIIKRNL